MRRAPQYTDTALLWATSYSASCSKAVREGTKKAEGKTCESGGTDIYTLSCVKQITIGKLYVRQGAQPGAL